MRSRFLAVAITAVLSVIGGVAGAVIGVSITQQSWRPVHEAGIAPVVAALERERSERAAEIAAVDQATSEAVAAARGDKSALNQLLEELKQVEASWEEAVALENEAKVSLATVIRERDELAVRKQQLEADAVEKKKMELKAVAKQQEAEAKLKEAAIRLEAARAAAKQRQQATGLPVEITNSIGMKFVVIPAGTFSMGSANGSSDEKPVHQVTISKPFYLGVHEVTNENGIAVKRFVPSRWNDARHPIEQVTWGEAVAFCEALSALPAERQAGRVYRLPTEAEWEYACRAGTTTAYSFGDDESLLGDFAWFGDNARSQTTAVGQKKPNAWGLYDMHGNVWEWCSDWKGDYAAGAFRDPFAPASGSYRVLRGGSWNSTAGYCRSARRRGYRPSLRDSYSGFRLALSSSGASSP